MVEYATHISVEKYEIPNIKIYIPNLEDPKKVDSSDIERLKIKSIEDKINESNIFKCVKQNPTFSGGTQILFRYLNCLHNKEEYLKIQSYWNTQKIKLELKSNPSNPHHKDALDLIDKITEIIYNEENPEDIKNLFTND